VHDFLVGGRLERLRHFDRTGGARQLGKIAVLDVGHRFAGEGGFEVFDGNGLGLLAHGFSCGVSGRLMDAIGME
jgi:hypothetical protein